MDSHSTGIVANSEQRLEIYRRAVRAGFYTDDDLVLERLPSGEYAWLRPSTEAAEDEDALFVLTYEGRRALRMAELFGVDR